MALLYAGLSALWILLSDRAVGWLIKDPTLLQWVSTAKGWLFVAVSATLIYLLLRQRVPTQARAALKAASPRPPWKAIVLVGGTIALVTALAVDQAWRTERQQAGDRLQAIAKTKADHVSDWYAERLLDAQAVQQRVGLVELWLRGQGPDGAHVSPALAQRLGALTLNAQVRRVGLFDQRGRALWHSAGPELADDPVLQAALGQALATGRPRHVGPWRDAQGQLRLAFLAPVAQQSATPAVVVLHTDPSENVHPALAGWPLPQQTAEAFLFTRDGDDVLFLSDLRFEAGATARKRLPLTDIDLFATQLLRGDAAPGAVLDGHDYRGVTSLAVGHPVSHSGWWVLAKQDRTELLAGAIRDSLWMVLSGVLGLLSAAVGLYLVLQRQRLVRSANDIAALQRIERALSESESRYRLLAENGSDVVWLLNLARQRFDYVSPSVQHLRGYTVDQVLGQSLQDVLTPESYQRVSNALPERLAAFAAGDASARTQIHELAQTHRNGHTVPTEVATTLITDAKGQVVQVLGVSRDITARKAAEAEIHKLSQATEQSPASVIITGLDARIEYVNAAFERISGYHRDEVLGRDPKLLRSGKTPRATFGAMWAALSEGRSWSGEVVNRHKDGHDYVQTVNIAPVRNAAGQTTHYLSVQLDVTAQRLAEEQAHRLAWFDPLTGLPNRHRLLQELADTLGADRRSERHSALLLLNVDRFKTLNDALGHQAGDTLLRQLAARLQALSRPGDLLARLSGDEYALLQHGLEPQADAAVAQAMRLAQSVHQALEAVFVLDGGETVNVNASVGVSLLPVDASDNPGEVLRRADTALHRAKDAGGHQSAFFDASMGRVVSERFAIEQDLRRGLAAGELRLYLQPQVNAAGRMVSAEALVRWAHPEQGLVPPGVFIPVAEESELIADLGDWVLAQVCDRLGALRRQGHHLPMSVNVSPRQFHRADFVPRVLRQLDHSGARAADLMLEITEGVVVDRVEQVIRKMTQLTEHGVGFSIDDFGTGYSSLGYLKRLPIHELKIDKSFVQDAPRDPNDAAVVEAILSVARHLKLKVVAEGVETQAQADFLNARAEVIHQGYLFGRPEPAEALLARWVDAQSSSA